MLLSVWSPRHQIVIVHFHQTDGFKKLILVNSYHPPHLKSQSDEELQVISTSLQEFHPGTNLLVAGDLNRPFALAQRLACSLNLTVMNIPRTSWQDVHQWRPPETSLKRWWCDRWPEE